MFGLPIMLGVSHAQRPPRQRLSSNALLLTSIFNTSFTHCYQDILYTSGGVKVTWRVGVEPTIIQSSATPQATKNNHNAAT
jgi:hypothetical protein